MGIIDEAIKRNISPHDFITLITPARLKEINHSAVKRLGVESLKRNTEYQKLVKEIKNIQVPSKGPHRIQTTLKLKNPKGRIPEFRYRETSPGYFTGETYPGHRAGTRQVFHFDISQTPRDAVDPALSIAWGRGGRIERILWPNPLLKILLLGTHFLLREGIERYGEAVTDQFFGMKKLRKNLCLRNAEVKCKYQGI